MGVALGILQIRVDCGSGRGRLLFDKLADAALPPRVRRWCVGVRGVLATPIFGRRRKIVGGEKG